MIDLTGQHYFLYDGDCGICAKCVEYVVAVDKRELFKLVPFQSVPENELHRFGITYADCDKKVHIITRRGKVYGGAFAVNYFWWQYVPWLLIPVLMYAFPPFLLLELIVYKLVALNRLRISQWLGLRACGLKPKNVS